MMRRIAQTALLDDNRCTIAGRARIARHRPARTGATLRSVGADHSAHGSSDGVVRGNVDSLMKLVDALAASGIELIGEGATRAAAAAACGSNERRQHDTLRRGHRRR